MKRAASLICLALVLAGCDSTSQYFPLAVNDSASYRLRGFMKTTTMIKVKRVVSVAGSRGFELEGPSGLSRIGWSNGTLYADQLANARFVPPIPLLAPNKAEKPPEKGSDKQAVEIPWQGTLGFLETTEKATGKLAQVRKTDVYNGRTFNMIEATLSVTTPERTIEVVSTYAPGIGLVKQQQRTNGQFDLELTRL